MEVVSLGAFHFRSAPLNEGSRRHLKSICKVFQVGLVRIEVTRFQSLLPFYRRKRILLLSSSFDSCGVSTTSARRSKLTLNS